jgi:hypothetical protein
MMKKHSRLLWWWITPYLFFILFSASSTPAFSQENKMADSTDEEIYYIGINPVAAITAIKGNLPSLYLPQTANLETGLSVFVGKIWNQRFNVETRLSFGSPSAATTLFLVQSGTMYCFVPTKKHWHPYAGVFLKIYALHNTHANGDLVSTIAYACVGNRFIWKRVFADLRVNENLYAISWSNNPDRVAKPGFQPSLNKWKSPYIPFIGFGIGVFFK